MYLMQVASDDEETQKQGIVFIFMLALRAAIGGGATATKTPAAASDSAAPPRTAASIQRVPSDNIFAVDSDESSEERQRQREQQEQASLLFSPHERSHQHNHTRTRIRVLSKVFRCGPVRVGAIHVCTPNRIELLRIKFDFLQTLRKQERVRTKFHNGTSMECSLSLNKVGIPTDRLPLKYDGTIKTEDHEQWIAIQEAKEAAIRNNRSFDVVECPMNMDILSGKFMKSCKDIGGRALPLSGAPQSRTCSAREK